MRTNEIIASEITFRTQWGHHCNIQILECQCRIKLNYSRWKHNNPKQTYLYILLLKFIMSEKLSKILQHWIKICLSFLPLKKVSVFFWYKNFSSSLSIDFYLIHLWNYRVHYAWSMVSFRFSLLIYPKIWNYLVLPISARFRCVSYN